MENEIMRLKHNQFETDCLELFDANGVRCIRITEHALTASFALQTDAVASLLSAAIVRPRKDGNDEATDDDDADEAGNAIYLRCEALAGDVVGGCLDDAEFLVQFEGELVAHLESLLKETGASEFVTVLDRLLSASNARVEARSKRKDEEIAALRKAARKDAN